jgi:thioredoxin 2
MNADTATAADSVLVACPECHALVRVPGARLGEHPKCARCKSEILGHAPAALDEQSFETHATRADLPVLVDFWAPWCGPCRMMAPVLDRAAPAYATRLQIGKVNTDEHPELAGRYGIQGIPTLILFQHGREIARQSGVLDGAALSRFIEQSLER